MKILALEFSSSQRSVGVVTTISRQTGPIDVAEVIETGGSVARPFEMIEEVLRQARIEREQIECVAVALGPMTGTLASLPALTARSTCVKSPQ